VTITPSEVDAVKTAKRQLMAAGAHLMSASEVNACVGANDEAWKRFSAHWDELAPDVYAGSLGTERLRRYGHFAYRPKEGGARLMPHRDFAQPHESNPLYVKQDRHFEPLTDRFVADPLLHAILKLLGQLAAVLDDRAEWSTKVHPFRVMASDDDGGQPTPEGLHRDGVTLVTSLLINRRNATGGESSVVDAGGQPLMTTTLAEPGTLLIGDDRRTLHGVSPIRPDDPAEPAQRDVLVITFAPFSQR
jgi:hypothetical protein